jgi:anaerobic dimethyl sulfoxide reductase subunit B (iron-sulfur subunit)
MTQYGFFFDQSRCYGCQACSVACKDWHDIEPGPEKWMSVYEWETGAFPDVRIHILAWSCGHCDNPACVDACDQGALFKEDSYGAVLVDTEKCLGERNCFAVCPYGAPKFASDAPGTKMTKCNLCVDRLAVGDKPVCVLSCPMRAFDFGPIEELRAKYGDSAQLAEMPDPSATRPNYVLKPHRPRQQFVPVDSAKIAELQKQRGNLGTIFEDSSDITAPDKAIMGRNRLTMKNATAAEVMAATRNDLG